MTARGFRAVIIKNYGSGLLLFGNCNFGDFILGEDPDFQFAAINVKGSGKGNLGSLRKGL